MRKEERGGSEQEFEKRTLNAPSSRHYVIKGKGKTHASEKAKKRASVGNPQEVCFLVEAPPPLRQPPSANRRYFGKKQLGRGGSREERAAQNNRP